MRTVNHYDVLGLEWQAQPAQVKAQYRRLAKRYHPDLNPNNPRASQQFLEVQAAYDVLSDPEKRRAYDQTLQTHHATEPDFSFYARPRPQRASHEPQTHMRGRPVSRPHQPRAAYSHYNVNLNLQELFRGARRHLTVGQTFTCNRCRGSGKLESSSVCGRCGGYGFVVSYQRVDINIPPGLYPGMSIRLDVRGDMPEHPMLDAPLTTNISVMIQLGETGPFEYHDHQLYITAEVPFHLLASGGEWKIPAPEGGELCFKVPANTANGSVLTLRKRGLRNGTSQRRGNLLCKVVAKN